MFHRVRLTALAAAIVSLCPGRASALNIETNFPGASIHVIGVDPDQQVISFLPANHPGKGWICWWHFRLTDVNTNIPIQLSILSTSAFGRPSRAMYSHDGVHWQHTEQGRRQGSTQLYTHRSTGSVIHFAWGPPFQLSHAKAAIDAAALRDPASKPFTLCVSKEGRAVPAIRWDPPAPANGKRRGVWIEARQHAWESGSSWTCRGLLEWLSSDDPAATRLKHSTRIVVVPIMDVDNVERGAGGKDQLPRDHNRDWDPHPVWPEVAAAQKEIAAMNAAGEFDLFLDLHNPGPGDTKPFFFAPPDSLLTPERAAAQTRFHEEALKELGGEALGLSGSVRISGPGYHPLWRKISKNWVVENTADHVVALTLETAWNTTNSTPAGYLAHGRALGRTIAKYLAQE